LIPLNTALPAFYMYNGSKRTKADVMMTSTNFVINEKSTRNLITGGWWKIVDDCRFSRGLTKKFKVQNDYCLNYILTHTALINEEVNICFDDNLLFKNEIFVRSLMRQMKIQCYASTGREFKDDLISIIEEEEGQDDDSIFKLQQKITGLQDKILEGKTDESPSLGIDVAQAKSALD